MSSKEKALTHIRKKLDELEIKLGTYRAADQMLRETNASAARKQGIAEFFRRWVHE
jgi:hypothetical protein